MGAIVSAVREYGSKLAWIHSSRVRCAGMRRVSRPGRQVRNALGRNLKLVSSNGCRHTRSIGKRRRMLSQREIRGKQKLASIAPLVAASAAEVSNPCRRQRPLISSTLCDAVSVQEPAFQRSLPCASQSRRTSADRYPPLRPAPFRQRPATLAVCASLPAMPEYNRPHRARCGAYGHPAAGSEHGRRATRTLSIAHHAYGLPIPIEIGPHVGAALAADLADETMLYVGKAKG